MNIYSNTYNKCWHCQKEATRVNHWSLFKNLTYWYCWPICDNDKCLSASQSGLAWLENDRKPGFWTRPSDPDPIQYGSTRVEPICYYEFGSVEHIMMDAIIAGLWQSIKNVSDWLDSKGQNNV